MKFEPDLSCTTHYLRTHFTPSCLHLVGYERSYETNPSLDIKRTAAFPILQVSLVPSRRIAYTMIAYWLVHFTQLLLHPV